MPFHTAANTVIRSNLIIATLVDWEPATCAFYQMPVVIKITTSIYWRLSDLFQAELTQSLQQLSEKAKSATEVIHRLKSSSERVQVNDGWPSVGGKMNEVGIFIFYPFCRVLFIS